MRGSGVGTAICHGASPLDLSELAIMGEDRAG
jgi:hypothetical protein